jgi:phage terminase small subunit
MKNGLLSYRLDPPASGVFILLYKKGGDTVTPKQKRFCDEYLIDCNATNAAIRAGYSEKTAYSIANENLKKPEIRAYIDERLEKMQSETIASATEVIQYLTSVLRGKETEEVVVVEGCGEGYSSASTMEKAVGAKERLKAAELLAKRYGLLTDKVGIEGVVPIVISGGDDLED